LKISVPAKNREKSEKRKEMRKRPKIKHSLGHKTWLTNKSTEMNYLTRQGFAYPVN